MDYNKSQLLCIILILLFAFPHLSAGQIKKRIAEKFPSELNRESFRDSVKMAFFEILNEDRESRSINKAIYVPQLDEKALSHSKYMAWEDYITHNETNGGNPSYTEKLAGQRGCHSECILSTWFYIGMPVEELANNIFNTWKESPPHYKIISAPFETAGLDFVIHVNKNNEFSYKVKATYCSTYVPGVR
jgi:uncharacterized protein YkwD